MITPQTANFYLSQCECSLLHVEVVRDFEGRSQGPPCSPTTVEEMGQIRFLSVLVLGFFFNIGSFRS